MNPIVGIGELLWDVYPDGRKVAGGAPFNFAFHCHQLGHPAVIVSRVGDDDLGRELREEVRRLGLSDEYIQTDREHPTGTVRVMLDEHKVPTYTITENVAWDYIEWNRQLEELAWVAKGVCYGTLAHRHPTASFTIRTYLFMSPGHRVFDINFRQQFFKADMVQRLIPFANWLKLNESELPVLRRLLEWGDGDDLDTLQQVAQLPARSVSVLCLSRGHAGCRVLRQEVEEVGEEGEELIHTETIDEPGVPIRVVDTVGAGDAFTAAMVCLHLEGRSLRDCAYFANRYAARVCEYLGAIPRIDRANV